MSHKSNLVYRIKFCLDKQNNNTKCKQCIKRENNGILYYLHFGVRGFVDPRGEFWDRSI